MANHTVTISNTATTSPAINVASQEIVGLSIGTVAATAATFVACSQPPDSPKGGATSTQTFRTVRPQNTSAAYTVITTDDSYLPIDPPIRGAYQIKIIANVAASGDESWTLVTRPAAG